MGHSDFRPVPDNQEVYVSMTDDTDISLIIDIAQRLEAPNDSDAVDVHFEDVAVDQARTAKVFVKEATAVPNLYGISSLPPPTSYLEK